MCFLCGAGFALRANVHMRIVPFVIIFHCGKNLKGMVFAMAGVVSVSVVFMLVWEGSPPKKEDDPRA